MKRIGDTGDPWGRQPGTAAASLRFPSSLIEAERSSRICSSSAVTYNKVDELWSLDQFLELYSIVRAKIMA